MSVSMETYAERDDTFFDLEWLVHMLVTETHRILHYPAKWFQSHQHMPDEVLQAYTELLQEWYTHYL